MGLKDDLIRKYIHAPKRMRKVTDRVVPGSRKLKTKIEKRSAKGEKIVRSKLRRFAIGPKPKKRRKKR